VTGQTIRHRPASNDAVLASDWATVAYDASTGDSVWVHRYDGPKGTGDVAIGIAIGPDGRHVYVTGVGDQSRGLPSDATTIAYLA
jgi:outer membrane protein assembly factor BamB